MTSQFISSPFKFPQQSVTPIPMSTRRQVWSAFRWSATIPFTISSKRFGNRSVPTSICTSTGRRTSLESSLCLLTPTLKLRKPLRRTNLSLIPYWWLKTWRSLARDWLKKFKQTFEFKVIFKWIKKLLKPSMFTFYYNTRKGHHYFGLFFIILNNHMAMKKHSQVDFNLLKLWLDG